jgi:hypothetical protein
MDTTSTGTSTPLSPGSDELVTVATFNEPVDAGLAHAALESAGIASLLRSANANSLLPFAFESQLQVRSSDEAAALEILGSAIDSPPSEAEVTSDEEAAEKTAADAAELPGESTED